MNDPTSKPSDSTGPHDPADSDDNSVTQLGSGPQFRESVARFEEGQLLGEFKLVQRLGQGGMAQVWLAEQTSLKRNVALKLLRPDMMSDVTYVKRFQTEAKAAAGLTHPNIVQVYVIGEENGQHFIAQEYVQGNTLRALIQKKGPLDVTLALHLMRQVAGALQAAGERGIVHRDIKPENIMLTKKGEAKVADFGLAQLTIGGEKLNLTQEGVTMGTPLYMSPEQVNGKPLDSRSDIYSFGVSCYHMLSGRPPFQGETAIAVAVQHLKDVPKPLKEVRPDLPRPVCDLVHRMMAKNPDDRYPNAAAVLEDVRKLIRSLKETGRVDGVELAPLAGDQREVSATFAGRHPIIALTLLCLLAGSASAGIGWLQRPVDPRLTQGRAESVGEMKLRSAEQQYLRALFLIDNEDAWLAVVDYWKTDREGQIWVNRAREQLTLQYLRHRERWSDAEREINELKSLRIDFEQSYTKGLVAEAALAAYRGETVNAKTILESSRQMIYKHELWSDDFETTPPKGGAWTRLIAETRQLIDHQSVPGQPNAGGPPTGQGRPNGPPAEGGRSDGPPPNDGQPQPPPPRRDL